MEKKKSPPQPPYLGVAYYPEDWDDSEIDYDIRMMQEAGINCARIGEFAWHKMEPALGQYDFRWLHRVVDKLNEAGIAVVMGTPTATPPIWLSRMYPDVLMENENGRRASHGGRRHCCSNNAHYREYSARIVEAMAQEFGRDPAIIGWQIDNEIYAFGGGCFCPNCRGRFAEHLRARFGTIDNLNAKWNLNLFSQAYDSFEEVVPPRDAWHNPHLRMEWYNFQNNSHIDFVHMQAEILHRYTDAPIGTDTMPFNGMNYRRLNEKLDVVQFNHYNEPGNFWQAALWFDYLRTMRPRPFWNTETQTSWNGSVSIGQSVKPEGYCRINTWLPLALGGEANMYWLWRTHWAGHELTHGSVLDASGRPMHIFGEVQECAASMKKAADFLNQTHVTTRVGLHFTSHNWNMMQAQCVVDGMNTGYIHHFYKPLLDCGIRPDVIDAEEELSGYDLILSPLMMTLEEADLQQRMAEWVRAGGVWVVGPLSDIRNFDGARYQHKPFGMLEELTGAKWLYGIPDRQHVLGAKWQNGEDFHGNLWYDLFEDDGQALAGITAGHSALLGKGCVMDYPVGKGHVILVGSVPDYGDLLKIYHRAMDYASIPYGSIEGEIIVAPRVGDESEGVVLIEYGNYGGEYRFDGEMTNLFTGEKHSGSVHLKPYEIVILTK